MRRISPVNLFDLFSNTKISHTLNTKTTKNLIIPTKVYDNFDHYHLLENLKSDSEFGTRYMLTSLLKCPVSVYTSKNKYTPDIINHLNTVGEIICFSIGDTTRGSYYFFYKDCIIAVSIYDEDIKLTITFATSNTSVPINDFDDHILTDKSSRVSILVKTSYGLETRSIKVDPIKVEDINLNYGSGFEKTHNSVVEKINKKTSSIMFFHGPPGCGKSSYIKYLTNIVEKEFIFIPVAFAGELSSPDFMALLLDHKDSVLILEDSEKVVQSRDVDCHNVSTVSTLLNISDGILGSMLNIKIIATYNGDKDKVDKALLRPGRLAIDHTFGNLNAATATKLAKSLGKDVTFDKEMSLAEVYNIGDETGYKEKVTRKIGFGV